MCPDPSGFGMMQAIQSTLWKAVKIVFKEFIHSYTKAEIKEKIFRNVWDHWISISTDGSSWDSSQFPELQAIESYFLECIRPSISKLIAYNKDLISPDEGPSADQIENNVMKAFSQTVNHIFMKIPDIKSPTWPQEVTKRFMRTKQHFTDKPENDWVHYAINGTTFSGLSFRTTLGNTIRSSFYTYYYISRTGVPELQQPHLSKDLFVIASGDDVVMWVDPAYADIIRASIMSLTTRTREDQQIGLGQCVKEVVVGKSTCFDFCSLITWSPTDSLADLVLLPDVTKLFTQK